MLFNVLITDQDDGAECTFRGFGDYKHWGGVVERQVVGCASIQRELVRLEKWAERNLNLKKEKCKVLDLERNNSVQQDRLGISYLERSFAEKDLRLLVKMKLILSQQLALVAKKAKSIIRCMRKSVGSMSREGDNCSLSARVYRIWCAGSSAKYKRDMNTLK